MTPDASGEADGGAFEYENEGVVIENPSFVCEKCGYANVVLITGAKPAAKCTNCGAETTHHPKAEFVSIEFTYAPGA
mgnify:CR=1 FL=1